MFVITTLSCSLTAAEDLGRSCVTLESETSSISLCSGMILVFFDGGDSVGDEALRFPVEIPVAPTSEPVGVVLSCTVKGVVGVLMMSRR